MRFSLPPTGCSMLALVAYAPSVPRSILGFEVGGSRPFFTRMYWTEPGAMAWRESYDHRLIRRCRPFSENWDTNRGSRKYAWYLNSGLTDSGSECSGSPAVANRRVIATRSQMVSTRPFAVTRGLICGRSDVGLGKGGWGQRIGSEL